MVRQWMGRLSWGSQSNSLHSGLLGLSFVYCGTEVKGVIRGSGCDGRWIRSVWEEKRENGWDDWIMRGDEIIEVGIE